MIERHADITPAEPPNQPKQSCLRHSIHSFDNFSAKNLDERYAATVELEREASDAVIAPMGGPPPPWAPEPARVTLRNRPQSVFRGVGRRRADVHAGASARHLYHPDVVPPIRYPPQALPGPAPARSKRKPWILMAVAAIVIPVAGGIIKAEYLSIKEHGHMPAPSLPVSRQTVLPFAGLRDPSSVAVDRAGDVYVSDWGNNRVLKLAAGSKTQTVLPFTGLRHPARVAVDTAGDVYVSDSLNNRVLKLVAGSKSQTVLPFTGLNYPSGVAVDTAGDVYVSDLVNDRVVKLAAGSSTQTVRPLTAPIQGPVDLVVDRAGDLYVTDQGNVRVVKLAGGSSTQTVLPFTGLNSPWGVAVDDAGSVYVIDQGNARVVKLAAGSSAQTELSFAGLVTVTGVAVDSVGAVYVTDHDRGVVKLAAG